MKKITQVLMTLTLIAVGVSCDRRMEKEEFPEERMERESDIQQMEEGPGHFEETLEDEYQESAPDSEEDVIE